MVVLAFHRFSIDFHGFSWIVVNFVLSSFLPGWVGSGRRRLQGVERVGLGEGRRMSPIKVKKQQAHTHAHSHTHTQVHTPTHTCMHTYITHIACPYTPSHHITIY